MNSRHYGSGRAALLIGPFVWALVFTLSSAVPCGAHKVNLFAYVEGDRVVVEGYFGAKAKARDSQVEVFDGSGKKIHEGKTDQEGIFSFKLADLPSFTGGLRIVLEAGEGHKAEYRLDGSDLPRTEKRDQPPGPQPEVQAAPKVPRGEEPAQEREPLGRGSQALPVPGGAAGVYAVDQAALVAAMEEALDKKLQPIVRMLGKQERLLLEEKFGGPRLTDIVGGIGWIIGLAGVAGFFLGRRGPDKR